jgi:hypothetical protein
MKLFHIHKWGKWSKPVERTLERFDAPPALVLGQKLRTFRACIQERICETCGKYQWRKV